MYTVPGPDPGRIRAIRPTALTLGVLTGVGVLAATAVETTLQVLIYLDLEARVPLEWRMEPEFRQLWQIYQVLGVTGLLANLVLGLLTAAGAAVAGAGRNGGRITVWIAGGLAAAWHLGCSSFTLFWRAIAAAVASDYNESFPEERVDMSEHFPIGLLDAATVAGYAAGILALAAIIFLATAKVNAYFRLLKAARFGGPAV